MCLGSRIFPRFFRGSEGFWAWVLGLNKAKGLEFLGC